MAMAAAADDKTKGYTRAMIFDELMQAAGLTPRAYQRDLAEQVAEHLAAGAPIAIGVQATTGVGKTWALAHAALEAAQAGRRVIWSTHTTLLRSQVLATLERALSVAFPEPLERPALAENRGRADYPSSSRVMRLRHALADRKAPVENISLLDALARWPGVISDFVEAYGELPVARSLVCLTAACPTEENAAFQLNRGVSAAAQIVVQTHALTLIEARFGRLAADLVIFDEADMIPNAAASAVETRLTLDHLADLAEQAGIDIADTLDLLRAKSADSVVVSRDPAIANAAKSVARQLRAVELTAQPELGELLHDTADDLVHFANVEGPRIGAALVRDNAAGCSRRSGGLAWRLPAGTPDRLALRHTREVRG